MEVRGGSLWGRVFSQEGETLYVWRSKPEFGHSACQRFGYSPKHDFCWTQSTTDMFADCQRSSLKAKEAVFFLVIGILLSLVALGFAVMLHGRTGRKTLAASRISLWDPANNKSLIVTHKNLLPSSMPRAWKKKAKMKPLVYTVRISASGLLSATGRDLLSTESLLACCTPRSVAHLSRTAWSSWGLPKCRAIPRLIPFSMPLIMQWISFDCRITVGRMKCFAVDGSRVIAWTNNLPHVSSAPFLLFNFSLLGPLISDVLHFAPETLVYLQLWAVEKCSCFWVLVQGILAVFFAVMCGWVQGRCEIWLASL